MNSFAARGAVGLLGFSLGLSPFADDVPSRSAPLKVPIVVTQIPSEEGRARASEQSVFDEARLLLVQPDGSSRVLSVDFHSACDPELSHDAQRLYFAGKRVADSTWGIWEMELGSGTVRCVIGGGLDCRDPLVLSSLFTLDSPEPWSTLLFVRTEAFLEAAGDGPATRLCTVKLDGSELRELTAAPCLSRDPVQLRDGRVVYTSTRHPLGRTKPESTHALFALHIDGTDQELFADAGGSSLEQMACFTEDGRAVFVEAVEGAWDGAGQLACVLEKRPLHTRTLLTSNPGILWLEPSALAGSVILVSCRSADAKSQSEVVRLDLDTGTVDPVWDSAWHHDVQAIPVRPRRVPDGRSTVVDKKFSTGTLYGLDSTIADPELQPHWKQGMVRRLRIVEAVPRLAGDIRPAPSPPEDAIGYRLVGEAPVEEDGSFHVRVPADIPLLLQTLDADGLALATCGWVWIKPRESRGCIGCHEDPELIPENRLATAVTRPANELILSPERRRSVGFLEHVFPILRSRCALAACHGDSDHPLMLRRASSISANGSAGLWYEALLARDEHERPIYVDPGRARTSVLVWRILGRVTARPWDGDRTPEAETAIGKMPPNEATPLTKLEARHLMEWIDLGAQWECPPTRAVNTEQPLFTRDTDESR